VLQLFSQLTSDWGLNWLLPSPEQPDKEVVTKADFIGSIFYGLLQ
jgi:hypothetical protein